MITKSYSFFSFTSFIYIFDKPKSLTDSFLLFLIMKPMTSIFDLYDIFLASNVWKHLNVELAITLDLSLERLLAHKHPDDPIVPMILPELLKPVQLLTMFVNCLQVKLPFGLLVRGCGASV